MTAVASRAGRRTPPGPRGHPLFGSVRDAQRGGPQFYVDARQRFGDVIRFRSYGPLGWYMISHPDDIEYIVRGNAANYPKGIWSGFLEPLVGQGLLTSEGDLWRRQRRLEQPAFHRQRLAALGATMAGAAEALGERWSAYARDGRPFDMMAEMSQLTLRVVGQTLLGADTSGEAARVTPAVTEGIDYVQYRLDHLFPLPEWVPTRRNRQFQRARAALDRLVYGIIDQRRRTGEDTGDLLSMLLLARDEETGEGMSDQQLRDEVMTIVLAGHETTAVTLTWTWYLLAKHPEVADKLRAELDATLGGRTPRIEDLANLPYTRMTIEEALRLYPPAWMLGRQAKEADEIRGYHIPAKALITCSQYVTHRHPDFWTDPERFDPERFAPERAAGRPRFAYFPFGGGQRQCIGNNFALMEAQLVLATLAQRYRPCPVPGHPVEPEPMLTLRPRHGMPMTLHERAVGG